MEPNESVARTLMSKGEYARYKERAPSAVSNWIAEGRLVPPAIIGEGQRAKVWVEEADRQLAEGLDPSQQNAQARPIEPTPPAGSGGKPDYEVPDDIRRKRKADADAAELTAEAQRRKLLADEGRWIEASDAKRAWGAELTRLVTEVDTFVSNKLANVIADEFELDRKAVATVIRKAYRGFRSEVADRARGELAERQEAIAEAAE